MSAMNDDLSGQGETGPSVEDILAELLDKKSLKFHTEIRKPDAMTGIDDYASWAERALSPNVAKLIKEHQEWKRTNMVPFQRGRSKEIIEAVKARIDAKKLNTTAEMLMGKGTR